MITVYKIKKNVFATQKHSMIADNCSVTSYNGKFSSQYNTRIIFFDYR